MREDDFMAFFKARESNLLNRIERAMGKPIARDIAQKDAVYASDNLNEYQEEEEG